MRLIAMLLACFSIWTLTPPAQAQDIWRGVDLSFVNELEDCGVTYRQDGEVKDPYDIFADAGANVVRLRLWVNPTWTQYSNLADVKRAIRRAKARNMRVLLDFHYSDTWADPAHQIIPDAWRGASTTDELAELLYNYTADTLLDLFREGLLPDAVQIGNEINSAILQPRAVEAGDEIDWNRQIALVNAGILAVRAVEQAIDRRIEIMIHVAQPDNVEGWFDAAATAGLLDFDIIGISYYPQWSGLPLDRIAFAIDLIRRRYSKDVVIVETAYPWTMRWSDNRDNILWRDALEEGYPATTSGQRAFLIDLMTGVLQGGGLGMVYWEPAWVSSRCQHGGADAAGSAWENATLFTLTRPQLHEGADFLGMDYSDITNARATDAPRE